MYDSIKPLGGDSPKKTISPKRSCFIDRKIPGPGAYDPDEKLVKKRKVSAK
jgi:hypothetical protein